MLRSEVEKTVNEITTALEVSGVSQFLKRAYSGFREGRNRQGQPDGMEAFRVSTQWMIERQGLSQNAISVVKIFGVEDLLDLNFWHKVVAFSRTAPGEKDDSSNDFDTLHSIRNLAVKLQFMEEMLPNLFQLFKQHTGTSFEDQNQNRFAHSHQDAVAILKVLLPEDDHSGSSPSRISFLMSAIEGLYEVCAAIAAQGSQSEVRVVAIDSGSDKSFDFLGLARVMEELRALILGIYDRRVAIRKVKHSDLLSTIVETLPVLQKLNDAEAQNVITSEECARLKRKLLSSIDQFEKSQAITPEMIDVTQDDPRQVMKDDIKFIEGPKDN